MIVPETIVAEDVETLGQDGVLPLHLARGTGQRLLVLSDLLLQDLVHVGGHLNLLESLHLPLQYRCVLVHSLGLESFRLEGCCLL